MEAMSKHYVVTTGEYDEYGVLAVYDSLDSAINRAWVDDPTIFFTCHDELPDISVYAPEYVETDFPERRVVYRAYIDNGWGWGQRHPVKLALTEIAAFTDPVAARMGADRNGEPCIIGTDKDEVMKWAEDKL